MCVNIIKFNGYGFEGFWVIFFASFQPFRVD